MESAFVRDESTQQDTEASEEWARPLLWVVPDLTPARPALPTRRPGRRAVVRARVWGVPLPSATDEIDPASADQRLAEAIRRLGAL
jgi:hypothetical protein